jgi:gamma-glutamylcyclotransferase (GGCT)/AIG2-like uncharacterized protein YtfP
MSLLFVYGTLKRGGENHGHLAGQRFVGETATGPGFVLYGLDGYPGLVRDPACTDGVTGELWDVDASCLRRLDAFEGTHVGLYVREPVPLQAPFDATPVDTYIYLRSIADRPRLGAHWPV